MILGVAAYQLVLRKDAAGDNEVAAVVATAVPSNFDQAVSNWGVLRLGTEQLINTATDLGSEGFILQSVDFRDELAQPITDAPWQADVTRAMREGRKREVVNFLDDEGDDVYIFAIELFNSTSRSAINVRRDGIVIVFADADRDQLLAALRAHSADTLGI